jgi:hypothetical protein
MYSGIYVKYPLFLLDFNVIWILSTVSKKYSNIRFYENPSSGSQVIPCRRTDRRTDMTKLIVAFCNFANAPKNGENVLVDERQLILQEGIFCLEYTVNCVSQE